MSVLKGKIPERGRRLLRLGEIIRNKQKGWVIKK